MADQKGLARKTFTRRQLIPRLTRAATLVTASVALSGCFTQTLIRGNSISEDRLAQVEIGASREQIDLLLGTPSTTATLDGLSYYYISQIEETTAFLAPQVVEQRVVAIYFDAENRVSDVGNFGLQDGKVFDFIKRKTRTTGRDVGLIGQILSNAESGAPQQLFQ